MRRFPQTLPQGPSHPLERTEVGYAHVRRRISERTDVVGPSLQDKAPLLESFTATMANLISSPKAWAMHCSIPATDLQHMDRGPISQS